MLKVSIIVVYMDTFNYIIELYFIENPREPIFFKANLIWICKYPESARYYPVPNCLVGLNSKTLKQSPHLFLLTFSSIFWFARKYSISCTTTQPIQRASWGTYFLLLGDLQEMAKFSKYEVIVSTALCKYIK